MSELQKLVDTDENLKEMEGKRFFNHFFSIFKKFIELDIIILYIELLLSYIMGEILFISLFLNLCSHLNTINF